MRANSNKIFVFVYMLFWAFVPMVANTKQQILLIHNGEYQYYDAGLLQEAVSSSVLGDTIVLSEGTFTVSNSGTLVIDKPITLIGTGENSEIHGDISLDVTREDTIHYNVLHALKISGNVIVNKKFTGLRIKKCWIAGVFAPTAAITDVQMEQCYIKTAVCPKNVSKISFVNCFINTFGGSYGDLLTQTAGSDIYFLNCSIAFFDGSNDDMNDLTFENCILPNYGYMSLHDGNKLINTLIKHPNIIGLYSRTNRAINCYVSHAVTATPDDDNDGFPTFSIAREGELTPEKLSELKYLGTDSTVIGARGGRTPYSLVPDYYDYDFAITPEQKDTLTHESIMAEYFFDSDPGYGKALRVQNVKEGENRLAIDLSGLATGAHMFAVRWQDEEGKWSSTIIRPLYVYRKTAGIVALEYFFDKADPGQGMAHQVALPENSSNQFAFEVSLEGLSVGEHVLNVRAKDSYGLWTATTSQHFMLTNNDSGIGSIMSNEDGTALIFTVGGYRTTTQQRGPAIIKSKNGKTRKVIIK